MSRARHVRKREKKVSFPTSLENQEQTPEVQLIPCAISLEHAASLALATLEEQSSPCHHMELWADGFGMVCSQSMKLIFEVAETAASKLLKLIENPTSGNPFKLIWSLFLTCNSGMSWQ